MEERAIVVAKQPQAPRASIQDSQDPQLTEPEEDPSEASIISRALSVPSSESSSEERVLKNELDS